MINVVKNKLPEIIEACKELHVQSLYLFGSDARTNDYHDNSDLDFLFSFQLDNTGNLLPPFYDYFDLMFKLEEITGKKVDLVAEKKVKNKFFLEQVLQERIKLYEH
jgi:predicted nucleotidyltransferase